MEELAAKKRKLFEQFREETLKQFAFIQAKDPEKFHESVQLCEELRVKIEEIAKQQVSIQVENEIKEIVSEIMQIREQISTLIPGLQEYLLNKIKGEQQKNKIKKGYGEAFVKPPSVFFDKRK